MHTYRTKDKAVGEAQYIGRKNSKICIFLDSGLITSDRQNKWLNIK